jgi:hypothetical protein
MEQESAAKDKTIAAKTSRIADAQAKIAQLEKDKAAKDSSMGPAAAASRTWNARRPRRTSRSPRSRPPRTKERETRVSWKLSGPERTSRSPTPGRIAQLEKDRPSATKQNAPRSLSARRRERDARERLEKDDERRRGRASASAATRRARTTRSARSW